MGGRGEDITGTKNREIGLKISRVFPTVDKNLNNIAIVGARPINTAICEEGTVGTDEREQPYQSEMRKNGESGGPGNAGRIYHSFIFVLDKADKVRVYRDTACTRIHLAAHLDSIPLRYL